MKSRKGMMYGGVIIVFILLATAIWVPRIHTQKEQVKLYLNPVVTEVNLLSSSIQDVTNNKNNDISMELDAVKKQFDSFMTVALDTKNITKSEIEGFSDFESVLGHCQSRIRVIVEANQSGDPLVPDEISFLNTLDHSLCVLGKSLINENGTLSITNARQYSDVITVFTETIRKSEK